MIRALPDPVFWDVERRRMTALAMAAMTGNARTGVDGIHFANLLARVAAAKDREAQRHSQRSRVKPPLRPIGALP